MTAETTTQKSKKSPPPRTMRLRFCVVCDEPFESDLPNKKTCRDECRDERAAKRAEERKARTGQNRL